MTVEPEDDELVEAAPPDDEVELPEDAAALELVVELPEDELEVAAVVVELPEDAAALELDALEVELAEAESPEVELPPVRLPPAPLLPLENGSELREPEEFVCWRGRGTPLMPWPEVVVPKVVPGQRALPVLPPPVVPEAVAPTDELLPTEEELVPADDELVPADAELAPCEAVAVTELEAEAVEELVLVLAVEALALPLEVRPLMPPSEPSVVPEVPEPDALEELEAELAVAIVDVGLLDEAPEVTAVLVLG